MTREELLKEIEHALKYRQCRSEEVEEIKQAFKELKQDLERLEKLEEENSKLLIDNERLDIRICTLEEIVNINRKINELATKAVNENEKLKQALDILKDILGLYLDEETFEGKTIYALMSKTLGICISNHTKGSYELLKEVLGNDK